MPRLFLLLFVDIYQVRRMLVSVTVFINNFFDPSINLVTKILNRAIEKLTASTVLLSLKQKRLITVDKKVAKKSVLAAI